VADTVEFWFDAGCPFTWRTSRWLVDVATQRGLDVRWHVMSLGILNQGREIPEQYRALVEFGNVVNRLFQGVKERAGNEALGRLYTEYGTRVHDQGSERSPHLLAEAVAAAGLPPELTTAGDDDAYQAQVAASHAEGQERAGQESGSPIVAIGDGPGFFGPIVVPVPQGEQAGQLFDAVATLSRIPAFSELKRARAAF
jgi:2-hydroxychromene-2-carboxylate isomerase